MPEERPEVRTVTRAAGFAPLLSAAAFPWEGDTTAESLIQILQIVSARRIITVSRIG